MRLRYGTFLLLLLSICIMAFVIVRYSNHRPEVPVKVSLCELKSDPAAYNHKLVEVTAFVSHGFEDFTLFDPTCAPRPSVWLEYGGTSASGTMYCCGVTAERSRPEQLKVEDIPIPLVEDERFREFDKVIRDQPDSVMHATIVGRFFSGKLTELPGGTFWIGYGHAGCCSLLAIQQIVSVEPQDRDDLDYRAVADYPDIDNCGYKYLTDQSESSHLIEAQKSAENGQRDWAFTDPQRVGSESLARILEIDESSITGLKQAWQAQGRFVYEWRPARKKAPYMVVVSRPSWLSHYAKDPKRVAWVVIAAYEITCG